MNINISNDAVEFIKERGRVATIRHSQKGWCHTGSVDVPTIHLGEPKNSLEGYIKVEEKGVIIYIIRNIRLSNNEIKISLSKLFKWKKLSIEGVLVNR